MSENTQAKGTQEKSIIYALSDLEPHTVDALVEVLKKLAQIIDSQHYESYPKAYEEDARQAVRDQLSLEFFDDSDIARGDTNRLPF